MLNIFNSLDILTILIILAVFLPLLIKLFFNVSESSIWVSIVSTIRLLEIILSLIVSYFITLLLFFKAQIPFFLNIKDKLAIHASSSALKYILVYVCCMPIFFTFVYGVLRIISIHLENDFIIKLSKKIYKMFDSLWKPAKILLRILFDLPKVAVNIFIICLILNIYYLYFPINSFTDWIEKSSLYNIVHQYAIEPIIKSSYVQKVPVLLNEAITFNYSSTELQESDSSEKLPERLENGTKIIWYFNGVTLDEAIKSNDEIDNFARSLAGSETDSRIIARKFYRWISSNISYDYVKAEKTLRSETDMPSGAIPAFEQRKGICFDYSSLYVAMCRAVGIKVRIITGMGYDGTAWGQHAWNQVYISEEGQWINVDTTFAVSGNYFDRPGFELDHKAARIIGEW